MDSACGVEGARRGGRGRKLQLLLGRAETRVKTGREKVVEGVKAQGKVAKRPVNSSRPGMWAGR